MNCAQLYSTASEMQRRDAAEAMSRSFCHMTWDKDGSESVLDIGCGSGEVTRRILLPLLPSNWKLVAVDASEEMVSYASSRHKHPRLCFKKMDIATPYPRTRFPLGFRKIFSFFCLHWVQEQKQAMKNVHDLLVPGGEALLVFLASNPIFNLYEMLATSTRWSPFMKDYKKYVSPYYLSTTPRQDMHDILEETGFDVRRCECRERVFIYNGFTHLRDAIIAVNPFLDRIPHDLQEEYLKDCLKESNKLENRIQLEDGKVAIKYHLFEVLVRRVNN